MPHVNDSRKVRNPDYSILLTSYNMAISFVDLAVVDIKVPIMYVFNFYQRSLPEKHQLG